MKKIFAYTILLGTMLLVSSCVQPLDDPTNMRFDGTFGIDLSVICTAPGTKADITESEKPGVDALNENTLTYVDWFIFKSDSDTGPALLHGRAGASDIVQTATNGVLPTEGVKIKGPIQMDNLVAAYGRSFYIYTLANLPDDTYSHSDDYGIVTGSDATSGAMTLAALKALPLVAKFNVNPFSEQDNFVMSGGKSFTFADGDKNSLKKVPVDLKRVAAKVTINMNVSPAIDQMTTLPAGGQKYEKTWYPSLSDVQVYLSFANSETTVKGDPIAYDQNKFFTYNRAAFTPTVSPATSTTPDWDDVGWRWNVTGTPFYSYPMSWTSDSPQAPFLKVILKWTSYKEDEDASYDSNGKLIRATARDPQSSQMIDAAKEFYYKVPIPAEVLNSNEWYHLTFDVAILGSTADELPVELGGKYCVVDWSTSNVQAGGDLKQGSYLSVYSKLYYIYGEDYIDIPVLSSHDITTTVTSVSWMDYSSNTAVERTSTNPATYSYLIRKPSTTDNGRVSFRFTHELMTDIAAATASNKPDVAEFTFTVQITNTVGKTETITIKQQPPLMIQNYRNTATTANQYGYAFVNGGHSDYGGIEQKYLSGTGNSTNANPNMYTIATSIAPSGTIIADPRQSSISYLGATNYNWTAQSYRIGSTGSNNRMQYYYPASDDEDSKNKIAPLLRIASSYGIQSGSQSYENCQRRCATYQEDGFPAGRWRIPTKAEIEYMVKLSTLGVIPSLFETETQGDYSAGAYFSADGGVVYPWSNGTSSYLTQTQVKNGTNGARANNWVRCVYDEWYWGTEDRLPTGQRNQFTWGDRQIQ